MCQISGLSDPQDSEPGGGQPPIRTFRRFKRLSAELGSLYFLLTAGDVEIFFPSFVYMSDIDSAR